MSIKGFNIDGKTEKYDYESLENKPNITDVLAEFKKKEIEYKCYYKYNTIDLAKRQDYHGGHMFSSNFTTLYSHDEEGDYYTARGAITFSIAEKWVDEDIKYYIKTPLKLTTSSAGSIQTLNKDSIIDFGMFNSSGDGVKSLHEALENMVDGTNIYEYSIDSNDTNANHGSVRVLRITFNFELNSRSEAVAQAATAQLQQYFEAYGENFLILYHNIPEIETIEGTYIEDWANERVCLIIYPN